MPTINLTWNSLIPQERLIEIPLNETLLRNVFPNQVFKTIEDLKETIIIYFNKLEQDGSLRGFLTEEELITLNGQIYLQVHNIDLLVNEFSYLVENATLCCQAYVNSGFSFCPKCGNSLNQSLDTIYPLKI